MESMQLEVKKKYLSVKAQASFFLGDYRTTLESYNQAC